MYMQAFGEVLTDALTVNPALVDIPSASSILDTSNYTFQAVTFGKDSQGFQYHAHSVSTTEETFPESGQYVYNGGRVLVQTFENTGTSSYAVSATHRYSGLPLYVSSLPNSPYITDTRLERGPTNTLGGDIDLGHYGNKAIGKSYTTSGNWNIAGSFPPAGSVGEYSFLDPDGVQVFSGTLSSFFNDRNLADPEGYVTIGTTTRTSVDKDFFEEGSYLFSSLALPAGSMVVKVRLAYGDAAALAAFGGVNHIGVYCLDLKAMLANGLTPPYAWDTLNNTRRYKLVAKVTFIDNLLFHTDYDPNPLSLGEQERDSGFKHILNAGSRSYYPLAPVPPYYYLYDGPVFGLNFNFI